MPRSVPPSQFHRGSSLPVIRELARSAASPAKRQSKQPEASTPCDVQYLAAYVSFSRNHFRGFIGVKQIRQDRRLFHTDMDGGDSAGEVFKLHRSESGIA